MIKRAVVVAAAAALFSLGASAALADAGVKSSDGVPSQAVRAVQAGAAGAAKVWIGHEEHRASAAGGDVFAAAGEMRLTGTVTTAGWLDKPGEGVL
ncbi:hypothetical protein ACFYST_10835 [Kitasatospora sp. NPDC004614]|uniref:hypothetical protein n=1 Tax=unclassified Kitasatospora TaxID=2633591 RepID=UPI00367A67BF